MKTQNCIIGCGWLGLPLATQLLKAGYRVNGSTTSIDKTKLLQSNAIDPFLISLTPEGVKGDIVSCLKDCETLVLNIPPGLRRHPEKDYINQMRHLIPYIEMSSVKQVLFVSSTSVYDDETSFPIIIEDSPTSTTSDTTKQLLAVEAMFQNNKNFSTTIVRFSGLFGDDRHPATYLSGKKNLKNPEAPVNLIHRKDCISILKLIIEQGIWNEVLNASIPHHPKKKDYYTSVCNTMEIPIPEFDFTEKSEGKIIDASKLVQILNYHFQIKL